MRSYPPGTKLRATVEGVVDKDGDLAFNTGREYVGHIMESHFDSPAVTIEVIERAWQQGDVARDAEGDAMLYDPAGDASRPWMGISHPHIGTRFGGLAPFTPVILGGKVVVA